MILTLSGNNTDIRLVEVTTLPKLPEPGIFYFSKEFETSTHLCPCGCGTRIINPIGKMNWSLKIKKGKPTLFPSLGNWELPCRSHYWIRDGKILWSGQWSAEQIRMGRQAEDHRRLDYLDRKGQENKLSRFLKRLRKFIRNR